MELRFSKEQLELVLDLPGDVNIVGVRQRGEDILVEVTGNLSNPDGLTEAPAMYSVGEHGEVLFAGYESSGD